MKYTSFFSLLCAASIAMTSCHSSSAGTCSVDESAVNTFVDSLYQRMTPEERLAQLCGIHLAGFFTPDGQLDTAKCAELLPAGIGHFSQFGVTQRKTPAELRDMVGQMQSWLLQHTPSAVPALFHEEVLSGVATYGATVYPQQIGMAGSFNTQLAEQKTFQTANSLRKIGGALALSPMVDVVRNPSFNRLEESYGEDAYLSAAMGVAFVRGLQHVDANGQSDLRNAIAATTKHFLGYGGGGNASEQERMEEILLPHEAIIRMADSRVVMTGYHSYDGTPCVANGYLQNGLLRTYLGFQGLMVSDYGSIEQIHDALPDEQRLQHTATERAALAINAGNDVDFPSGNSYRFLPEAMAAGDVSVQTFEMAVKRVLRLKYQLGLFDADMLTRYYAPEPDLTLDTPAERETAYQLATQSVVLLENNGILPLRIDDDTTPTIALVGPNANTMWAMLGDYAYHTMRFFWQSQIEDDMHPRIVTLRQGLQDRLPEQCQLLYTRGCDWTEEVETVMEAAGDPRTEYLRHIQGRKVSCPDPIDADELKRVCDQADVIVAAVGENVILCGENRDRKHLRLPGRQEEFVRQLIATGKPVVLVVFGGRAQVLGDLAERCAAVIQAWYPGEEGGHALADILLGKVSPSGRLSVTYPKQETYQPICYHYADLQADAVAYPFGYGLSYAQFDYAHLRVPKCVATNAADDAIQVLVDVTNAGNMPADEVVQLYLSANGHTTLQAFSRVSLQPGEKQTVCLALAPEQFGHYVMPEQNEEFGHWVIEPGLFTVHVARNAAETILSAEIELTGKPVHKALRTYYGPNITRSQANKNRLW